MEPLSPPDRHYLSAAEGWLELGNLSEARAELSRINLAMQGHPDVLHARWQLHRTARQWDACLSVASTFTETAPADPRAWTSLAQTFYYTLRIQEAYDLAVSKITRFPTYWPLYYDAACYACLTGRVPQARQFLQLASALGDQVQVQLLAAHDPDLKGLWSSSESSG